jgi:transposase-like protein
MSKAIEEMIVHMRSGEPETASDLVGSLMRRGMARILQESLEEEVTDFLGRPRYERANEPARKGYRNGYADKTVRTTEGRLQLRRPRVRDTEEPFASAVIERVEALEERLKEMALEMYVRGLSTRDIEETLTDEEGKALLSRSSVSRLTERLYEEYEAFAERDLSDKDVVYLFVDGVYEAVRSYTKGQAILCAWAILSDGRKELLHLSAAGSESSDSWRGFFEEMTARGLRQPLLVIHDGSAALRAAIRESFPESERQRCLVHKLRNIAAKLPGEARDTVLARVKAVYHAPDRQTADLLAERLVEEHTERYPSAMRCFLDDLDSCLTHLRYPLAHRRYIRSTNLLERAFVEEKRRTKVMPAHMHERGAMKLVFGVLIRASKKWNRVKMSSFELAQLKRIRQLMAPHSTDTETISFKLAA